MNEQSDRQILLTYRQLAERLSLPMGTLYSLVSRGEIPHLRIGPRLVRFRREEIDTWLDSKSSKSVDSTQKQIATYVSGSQ